jgi:hypothetical protein
MPSSPHAVKYCDVCRVATHVSSRACNICGRQYSSQARSPKQAAWILGGVCVSVLSVPLLLAALAQSVRVNDQVNDKSVIVQHADSIAEGSVVAASKTAVCAPTERGLDEIVKSAVQGSTDQAARAMLQNRGALINPGDQVKILEAGFLRRRVRILKNGHECLIFRNALGD